MELYQRFDKFSEDDQYLKFELVENKKSRRSDIHAFLLLDELLPGDNDIVSWAGHDEICLGVDLEDLNKVITDEQILELIRCGVRYDGQYDALAMFV